MASSKAQARAEARFMRGEVGVDGASASAEERDPSELEQLKAREALLRGRTWLGRECLTWLLWKSESTEPIAHLDQQPITVVFHGRLVLRAASGDITELMVKGVTAPYAALAKAALAKGLLVHAARLKVTLGEADFDVGVDAEFFDLRAVKLPTLLQEEEGERITERLELAGRLSAAVDALTQAFVRERVSRTWATKTVPALKQWMAAG